ncbi:unnamed protein product [Acanthocheilonema viteae]|uniref:Uncharacterized protein n=1 Tax=Acanthocheilonema viteae TaxID=6277 RepID=A0A498SLK4_ACAVI|nr:unnamed protein product [Acanthocheilonema viteae]
MVENNVLLNNPAMIRLYQIPARHTGIASLCIQLVGLVMSAALTLYLVLHLNDINITRNIKQQSKRPEAPYSTTFISTTMNATEINKDMNLTEKIIWDGNLISDMNGNGTIDETGLQIDLTELIQISAGVYTVVLGFALTSIICGFALAFNIAWYRYVVYMNDNDQCLCLSMTAHFFKCHRQQRPTQGYSIPEAVRHSNLPHANELAVHNFSRL